MSSSLRTVILLPLAVASLLIAGVAPAMASHGGLSSATGFGPVVNGDFELSPVPRTSTSALDNTPADECVGIGHQVFWGSETAQADATDIRPAPDIIGAALFERLTNEDAEDDPQPDPAAAADRVSSSPSEEALFLSGYGHCEFSSQKGQDQAWVNPAGGGGATGNEKAPGWSNTGNDNSPTTAGFYHDDDPFDREVRIVADSSLDNHNMWQSFGPSNAFTANFEALEFDVEAGSIPSSANVQLALSATPLERQNGETVAFFGCQLNFREAALVPDDDGHVRVDPTIADTAGTTGVQFFDRGGDDCDDIHGAWDDATTQERREMLGRLSIVQISFKNFNRGADDMLLDNIALTSATTVAEELAVHGNLHVCPDPDVSEVDCPN